MKLTNRWFTAVALTVALSACDKDEKATPEPLPEFEIAPSASAGFDANVAEGTRVTLDASLSSDEDGTIETYLWEQLSGPAVSLDNANLAETSFLAPQLTGQDDTLTVQMQITVTDDDGLTDTDVISIGIYDTNQRPAAAISGPTGGDALTDVTLRAENCSDDPCVAVADPDGTVASIAWSQTTGPDATFKQDSGDEIIVTLPDVVEPTDVTVVVTVTDNEGKSNVAELTLEVEPVADALAFVGLDSTALVVDGTWPDFEVHVANAAGDTIVGGDDSVQTITVTLSDGTGSLTGGDAMDTVAGVATFTGVSYDVAEADVIVSADADPLTGTITLVVLPLLPGAIGQLGSSLEIAAMVGQNVSGGTLTAVGTVNNEDALSFALNHNGTEVPTNDANAGFVAQYDVDGSASWVLRVHAGNAAANLVDIASEGTDLLIAGSVAGAPSIDDTALETAGAAAGGSDLFFSRHDNDGTVQWSAIVGGTEDEAVTALTTGAFNYPVVAASLSGTTLNIDPCNDTAIDIAMTGTTDAAIIMYDHSVLADPAGDCADTSAVTWSLHLGGDEAVWVTDLATEDLGANQAVYAAGWFTGTVDFGDGNGDQTPTTGSAAFVMALDADDGEIRWVNVFEGDTGDTKATALAFDGTHLWVGGAFGGAGDFDVGAGTTTLTATGTADGFVLSLDEDGVLVSSNSFGGTDATVTISDLVVGANTGDPVMVAGSFRGSGPLEVFFDDAGTVGRTNGQSGTAAFLLSLTSANVYDWVGGISGTGGLLPVHLGHPAVAAIDVSNETTFVAAGSLRGVGLNVDIDPVDGGRVHKIAGTKDASLAAFTAADIASE